MAIIPRPASAHTVLLLQFTALALDFLAFFRQRAFLKEASRTPGRKPADSESDEAAHDDEQPGLLELRDQTALGDKRDTATRGTLGDVYASCSRKLRAASLSLIVFLFAVACFAGSNVEQHAAATTALAASQNSSAVAVISPGAAAGKGIRVATWAQVLAVAVAVAALGALSRRRERGAREVGACVGVLLVAFATTTAAWMWDGTLDPADALALAIMIDAQASAQSVVPAAEQVPANRWRACVAAGFEALVVALVPIVAARLLAGDFVHAGSSEGSRAGGVTVFWWGWVGESAGTTGRAEAIFVSLCMVVRLFAFFKSGLLAVSSTDLLHRAMKNGASLRGISFPKLASPLRFLRGSGDYDNCLTTVSLIGFLNIMVSLTAAYMAMGASGLDPASDWMVSGRVFMLGYTAGYIMWAIFNMASFVGDTGSWLRFPRFFQGNRKC